MKKALIGLFISLVFLLSDVSITLAYEKEITSLSASMAENIAKAGKKSVAVVDFTDLQGNVTELGRFLAEEFSVALAGAGKGFEVVDRTHLKSIIAEHKLSSTGIIDPQTARKLGEIAGVEVLITGTITPFGDSVRISVKILDTATAKIIGASSGDIAKTKAIEELLARGIETGQSYSQQPSTSGYVPSISSQLSKKVGDIIVTVKRILVSKGQVLVGLDFFNSQVNRLRLAAPWDVHSNNHPSLIDEKGNVFEYESGIPTHRLYSNGLRDEEWLTLNPKSNNDVVLYFRTKDRNLSIKESGSNFAVSLKYTLYNPEEKTASNYSVSFTDIKAQMPR